MPHYRKKPVVIQAAQWLGYASAQFANEEKMTIALRAVEPLLCEEPDEGRRCEHCNRHMATHGWIETLESGHVVCPNDWIIIGVKGEYYPCKPDIFEATYDPA